MCGMAFPTAEGPLEFPLERFRDREVTRMELRVYFFHRHVRDTVLILEESNLPHPQCPCCDMLVPWKAFNGRHTTTSQCTKGAD